MEPFHVFIHVVGVLMHQLDELLVQFCLIYLLVSLGELVHYGILLSRGLIVARCWAFALALHSCPIATIGSGDYRAMWSYNRPPR